MKYRNCLIIIAIIALIIVQNGYSHSPHFQKNRIDAEAALQIVIEKVIGNSRAHKVIYISKSPIAKGKRILSMARTYTNDIFNSAWVFFIDDAPGANWEHPCRYVFIDERTGEVKVISGSSPPDDLDLFMKLYPGE